MAILDPPFYFVYGEDSRDLDPRFVHVERVGDRMDMHNGHVRPHSHPHLHQLSFWRSVDGLYAMDGDRQKLNGPALTWMPAGVVHGFDVTTGCDCVVLSMSRDFVADFLGLTTNSRLQDLLRKALITPLSGDTAVKISHFFDEIEREYRARAYGYEHYIGSLIQLVFLTLGRLIDPSVRSPQDQGGHAPLFDKFLQAVEQHFRAHISIQAYADLLGATPYLLNQATQAASGLRASRIVRNRIIQQAKRDLLYTAHDIAIIGFTLGFTDAAHFSRLFRNATGMSPMHWRMDHRRRMAGL